jgi:LmbE family N-acetylglucosaminyl deacetylase
MPDGKKRLLISMAHPDDESFGLAGTVAHYVSQGVEVYLICATNGDVGTVDPEFMQDYETVAELRLAELRCAAETLGFAGVYTLGYRDSGMAGSEDNRHPDSLAAADPGEVAARIVEIILEVKPQVIVTFDPYGGYGHPDHVAVHQATKQAFEVVSAASHAADRPNGNGGYQPQKLYFATFDRRWMQWIVFLLPLFGQDPEHYGRNKDINLREIAAHQYPIHARISTRDQAELAQQARDCHASQLGGFSQSGLYQLARRLFESKDDTFMRAFPPVNGRRVHERDLFAGVQLEQGAG